MTSNETHASPLDAAAAQRDARTCKNMCSAERGANRRQETQTRIYILNKRLLHRARPHPRIASISVEFEGAILRVVNRLLTDVKSVSHDRLATAHERISKAGS